MPFNKLALSTIGGGDGKQNGAGVELFINLPLKEEVRLRMLGSVKYYRTE